MILSVHFIAKSLEIGSISDIVKSGINSEDDIDRSESSIEAYLCRERERERIRLLTKVKKKFRE